MKKYRNKATGEVIELDMIPTGSNLVSWHTTGNDNGYLRFHRPTMDVIDFNKKYEEAKND